MVKLNCVSACRLEWHNKPTETFKAVMDEKVDVAVKVFKIPKGDSFCFSHHTSMSLCHNCMLRY